jgi:hypothetical protein
MKYSPFHECMKSISPSVNWRLLLGREPSLDLNCRSLAASHKKVATILELTCVQHRAAHLAECFDYLRLVSVNFGGAAQGHFGLISSQFVITFSSGYIFPVRQWPNTHGIETTLVTFNGTRRR